MMAESSVNHLSTAKIEKAQRNLEKLESEMNNAKVEECQLKKAKRYRAKNNYAKEEVEKKKEKRDQAKLNLKTLLREANVNQGARVRKLEGNEKEEALQWMGQFF